MKETQKPFVFKKTIGPGLTAIIREGHDGVLSCKVNGRPVQLGEKIDPEEFKHGMGEEDIWMDAHSEPTKPLHSGAEKEDRLT